MSSPEETLPLPAKQPAADPESGYLPKVLSMVDEVLARYSRTTTEILTTPTGQPFHGDNGRQEARASRVKVKLLLKEFERSKRQTPSTGQCPVLETRPGTQPGGYGRIRAEKRAAREN